MINKKPYIIPIPGTRKSTRLKENLDAANILLKIGRASCRERVSSPV